MELTADRHLFNDLSATKHVKPITSSLNFYRLNALPDARPTTSKHWRQIVWNSL